MEKLIGWSILVDCVLGARHPCVIATHNFAMKTGPLLQQFSNGVKPIKEAMKIILGTLLVAQQEFCYWLTNAKTATTVTARPLLPVYGELIKELEMGTYKIGEMPETWAWFMTTPKEAKPSLSASKPKTTNGGDNLKPNLVLQKRYKDSGSPALGAMMGPNVDKIPKAGTHKMCLSWALQGKCCPNCPHKLNHREIGAEATSGLHDFLNHCSLSAPRL
jgi:hypothetical protein